MNIKELIKTIKSNKYILKRLTIRRAINYILYKFFKKFNIEKCYHYPTKLDIVPTKACNLDCIFCIKYTTGGSKQLSLENFEKIAAKLFPYSLMVSFCSGGEPFLNKDMVKMLEISSEYNISTTIITNGTYTSDA
jgi:MoaA/NifB/PqqE/SkfB family radical SAM enzyme